MSLSAQARDAAARGPEVASELALELGLEHAAHQRGVWLIAIAVPTTRTRGAALLALPGAGAVWEPREAGDWAMAGVGAAAILRARGDDRFGVIARDAEQVWARLGGATVDGRVATIAELPCPPPRFVGGFAFAPGAAAAAPWAELGDAWFALPRWTHWARHDDAWLVLALTGDEANDRARWRAEAASVRAALDAAPSTNGTTVIARRDPDAAVWRAQVEDIRAAIARGELAKVVAARPCAVELAQPLDAGAVIARLAAAHPACTRFAIRGDGADAPTFLGASPERLIARRGRAVASEALAGSIGRDVDGGAALLLASAKDRGEHALVVDAIQDALARVCAELDVPATPTVRTLRQILHLYTPITGRLAAPTHVLELVRALHPTPAVGGTPTAAAMAWIAAREPAPRGWYAAPVGWFDASGDGELCVAIRSGVIAGRSAQIWAGAGIVRDSDVAAEAAEVELKQRALLGALGGA